MDTSKFFFYSVKLTFLIFYSVLSRKFHSSHAAISIFTSNKIILFNRKQQKVYCRLKCIEWNHQDSSSYKYSLYF